MMQKILPIPMHEKQDLELYCNVDTTSVTITGDLKGYVKVWYGMVWYGMV